MSRAIVDRRNIGDAPARGAAPDHLAFTAVG